MPELDNEFGNFRIFFRLYFFLLFFNFLNFFLKGKAGGKID